MRPDLTGTYDQFYTDVSQFEHTSQKIYIASVPENYLKVADDSFYYPYSLQEDVAVNKTENGYLDVVEMLYSNDSVSHYPGYPTNNTNYYNVMIGALNGRQKFT